MRLAAAGVGLAAALLLAPVGGAAKDDTTLISIAQVVPGGKANAFSHSVSVSEDGRYVAFQTQATNLVAADTNGDDDIYVRDTIDQTISLVTPGDGPADASGAQPAISDDGQRVAFTSFDRLAADDTNNANDAYVYDFATDQFTLASRPSGTAGTGGTVGIFSSIAISGDGSSVAFSSADNTLDPAHDADTDPRTFFSLDVFVRDLDTNTTELVSRDATVDGSAASMRPSLDDDGSRVGFDTVATNLDPDDTDTTDDVYVRNRTGNSLILVSRADDGTKGNAPSKGPALSADGAEVAFNSDATNLDPDDPAGESAGQVTDIYVRELSGNETELISRATGSSGAGANKIAQGATISADGNLVAFTSPADNLDPDQTTPGTENQVYVRDRIAESTQLESRADGLDGAVGDGNSGEAAISSDGGALAFGSQSTNLDPADTDPTQDAYARDLDTGETQLASQSPVEPPVNANGESRDPAISADGRYVAFTSLATNIDPDATDNRSDIFRRDTQTGETVLVSRADGAGGGEGDGASGNPSISADGRYVAFESEAENLTGDPSDGEQDIYVRDLVDDTTTLVSLHNNGTDALGFPAEPSISGDGMRVAFDAGAAYTSGDTNGATFNDVFVRDLGTDQTLLVSRSTDPGGSDGDSRVPDISAGGQAVAFESDADNLTGDGPTANQQIFVRRLNTDETVLASRASGATGAMGDREAREPTISGDGSVVAFRSDSSNLHPDKPLTTTQIFVRNLDTETTDVGSRATDGTVATATSSSPAISDDGTYLAFESSDADLGATTGRPQVFHRDLVTGETVLASRAQGPAGAEGGETSGDPSMSEHGRFVAFESAASNLDPADTDSTSDVYLRDVLGPDDLAPVTTIATGPADGSAQNTNTATFTFTVDEPGSTSECRLDGGAFAPCAGSFDTPALGDGPHTFEVRSTDRVGNVEDPAPSRTFTVDTTAPETTLIDPPEGPTADPNPSIAFTSSEAGATFECSLDGGAFSACASGIAPGPLADGDHTFAVRATDPVGNTDASPAQTGFTVDTAAPDTALVAAPQGLIADATPIASFTSPDPSATFRCAVDGAAFAPCESGLTLGPLADGDHTLAVRAVDAAGNPDPTPAQSSFTVDTAITGREVSAKDKQNQGKTVKVVAKLATGEGVTATMTGKVTTGKDLKLREVTETVGDGEGAKLVAKLKEKDNRKALDRLEDRKLKTKIEVTVTDAAGNSRTTPLKPKLKD